MFVTICLICAMFTKNEVQVLAKSAGRKGILSLENVYEEMVNGVHGQEILLT